MPECVIGIDAGGTMTKAALFDLAGRELACARHRNVMLFPKRGWTERDADAMWRAAAKAVAAVLEMSHTDPKDVLAVSVSGYGAGIYMLDARGNPVRPGIVSTDGRAAGLVDEWGAQGLLGQVAPHINQFVWGAQSLVLLAWLARHEPEVVRRTHKVSFCKDFLRARLCGDMSTDYSDAGSSGLFNVAEGRWSEEALGLLDMAHLLPKLPEVGPADQIVGRVSAEAAALSGLSEGTPVVRGAVDMASAAIASHITQPHEMSVVAGTFSIAATLHAERPKMDAVPMLQFAYPAGGYLSVQGSPTSASNLEWVCKTLLSHGGQLPEDKTGNIYDIVNAAVARRVDTIGDALFLPYLFGGPDGAPAGFLGMSTATDFDEMMQAVFEGIVFAHKADIDIALTGADAATPEVFRLTGGASRSPVWTQMFADILDLPMEVPVGSEFGAKGVAICAAAATGAYASLHEAMAAMTGIDRRHEVNAARGAAHRAKYPRFTQVTQALAGSWPKAAQPAVQEVAHA